MPLDSLTDYPNGVSSMGMPLSAGVNPFGSVFFVKASGGDDGQDGKSILKALATVARAIALGAVGDTIVLGPGTHSVDVSVGALTPLADMQFVAAIPPRGGKPSTIITHDVDDGIVIVDIEVDGVGFYGIEFLMIAGGAAAINCVKIADTANVNGIIFKDCWFNLNSVDAANVEAIDADDGVKIITGMVIQNCRFLGGDATTNQAVYINVGVGGIPDALIEDNVFVCESADGDARAILFGDPGAADKSYGFVIRNNDFIGPTDGGGDAVPIEFASAMTEDEIIGIIRTNYFSNCSATPITQDESNNSIVRNWVADDATGGTLVDPGT